MDLKGTYKNYVTNQTLKITQADDGGGTLSGTMEIGGRTMAVMGHYHFLNNSDESKTSLAFSVKGNDQTLGDRDLYGAWAGMTDLTTTPIVLKVAGAQSTLVSSSDITLCPLGGSFIRQ